MKLSDKWDIRSSCWSFVGQVEYLILLDFRTSGISNKRDDRQVRGPLSSNYFQNLTGLFSFSYRWVENKVVANRLIELWPSIEKKVRYWNKFSKSKQPRSKSYENVLQAVDDPFTTIKLMFFSYLAGILEPYLNKISVWQAYGPLHVCWLKSIGEKPPSDHYEAWRNWEIKNWSPTKSFRAIFLDLKNMQMGFGVEKNLRKLKSKDAVTEQISAFTKET